MRTNHPITEYRIYTYRPNKQWWKFGAMIGNGRKRGGWTTPITHISIGGFGRGVLIVFENKRQAEHDANDKRKKP